MNLLLPFLAAAAPFVVWPIEYLFPYPFIVEELLKLVIVSVIPRNTHFNQGIVIVVVCGLLFTTTESLLYLFNINSSGDFLLRFVLTALLHSLTFALIYSTWHKSTVLGVLGVLSAMIVHYIYNLNIAQLLNL